MKSLATCQDAESKLIMYFMVNMVFDHYHNNLTESLKFPRASCKFTHKVYTGEKLMDDESEILEKPLTTEELCSALYSMKANKSLGSDGLPADFLKIFWDKVKSVFKGVANFIFE